MANEQTTVLVKQIGAPVELGTRQIPSLGEGQVLVRVSATMLLPHDTLGRDWGLLVDQRLPAVLGSNVAGVVEKTGSGVDATVGERVFGISDLDPLSSDQAGLQEYAALNADAIGRIPEGFSDEQVVTLPINLVTSWTALFTDTGFNIPSPFVQKEKVDNVDVSFVIIGGGTNVGQLAVQLARLAGIGTIIVIAGPSSNNRLMGMGASHVINRHDPKEDIARRVQDITGQKGCTLLYSCAALDVGLVIRLLNPDKSSKLRSLLPIEGDDEERLRSERPLCDASYIADLSNMKLAPHAERFWAELYNWLLNGEILPTEYRAISGLDKVKEINEALDAYRDAVRAAPQTVVRIGM